MFASAGASTGIGKARFSRGRAHGYPTVSKCDPKYIGQLIESIRGNKPKALAKVLKKKHLDLNIFFRFQDDLEKMTPLQYAALKGKCQITNMLLLTSLCSVNLQTPFDEATALHFACRIHDSEKALTIVTDLLEHKAEVNLTDHWEKTAVIWACEGGHYGVVKLLLEKQADIDHCCNIEDPPPQAPVRFTSPINEHLYLDTYYGNGALIQACRFGHLDIAKELISFGCSINVTNMKSSTPLHAAAGTFSIDPEHIPRSSDPSILKYLIKCGSNLNLYDQFGFTPLARVIVSMYEISGLNFSLAEKLPLFLHCIEKAQILVKSGCEITSVYEFVSFRSTVLTQLLAIGNNILVCKCPLLDQEYCAIIEMLSNAGCPVSNADVQLVSGIGIQRLIQNILLHYENPFSLKCLCLMVVRKHTRSPLKEHITELDLPDLIQRQLRLE